MSEFKIFGREPTLWIAFLGGVVMLLGTLGLRFLDNDQAGLVVLALNGLFAAINAYAVRPISPAVFTYAVGTLVSLAAAYGLQVSPETLGTINTVVIMALALITRNQVAPIETAVSRRSTLAASPSVDATGAAPV